MTVEVEQEMVEQWFRELRNRMSFLKPVWRTGE